MTVGQRRMHGDLFQWKTKEVYYHNKIPGFVWSLVIRSCIHNGTFYSHPVRLHITRSSSFNHKTLLNENRQQIITDNKRSEFEVLYEYSKKGITVSKKENDRKMDNKDFVYHF